MLTSNQPVDSTFSLPNNRTKPNHKLMCAFYSLSHRTHPKRSKVVLFSSKCTFNLHATHFVTHKCAVTIATLPSQKQQREKNMWNNSLKLAFCVEYIGRMGIHSYLHIFTVWLSYCLFYIWCVCVSVLFCAVSLLLFLSCLSYLFVPNIGSGDCQKWIKQTISRCVTVQNWMA